MRYALEDWQDSIFSAGQVAPAGHYLRVDVVGHQVVILLEENVLPASLDGRIAEYVRLEDVGWVASLSTHRQAL